MGPAEGGWTTLPRKTGCDGALIVTYSYVGDWPQWSLAIRLCHLGCCGLRTRRKSLGNRCTVIRSPRRNGQETCPSMIAVVPSFTFEATMSMTDSQFKIGRAH